MSITFKPAPFKFRAAAFAISAPEPNVKSPEFALIVLPAILLLSNTLSVGLIVEIFTTLEAEPLISLFVVPPPLKVIIPLLSIVPLLASILSAPVIISPLFSIVF